MCIVNRQIAQCVGSISHWTKTANSGCQGGYFNSSLTLFNARGHQEIKALYQNAQQDSIVLSGFHAFWYEICLAYARFPAIYLKQRIFFRGNTDHQFRISSFWCSNDFLIFSLSRKDINEIGRWLNSFSCANHVAIVRRSYRNDRTSLECPQDFQWYQRRYARDQCEHFKTLLWPG
jgi:hypothetical protein